MQPQTTTPNSETRRPNYGKRATMPVLQSDCYAEINLPDLPQWDPLSDEDKGGLKIDSTVVCVGKRRTGKSWALRNIMYLMKIRVGSR